MSSPRGKLLWAPPASRRAEAALGRFLQFVSGRIHRSLSDYDALHRWSVEEPAAFWRAVWDFCGTAGSLDPERILTGGAMPGARWFEGSRLSFSENLLRARGDRTAIVFECEDESLRRSITFDELRAGVGRCAGALRALGVERGDRVAAFTPNVPETVIAMLAAASIGAIWSSCSPDFGPQAVLDRFGQIEPKVLFTSDECLYAGKRHLLGDRTEAIAAQIPSIQRTIVHSFGSSPPAVRPGQIAWGDFLGTSPAEPLHERLPFGHPLAILYTSGTTGVPKCIVHGAGGTLLKHLEEHVLQVDLRESDVFFYYTTCGWMMWNWLVSGLATGATIVLYDGSPLHPDVGRMFRLIDRNGITVFGTSPRFLAAVESSGHVPRSSASLSSLRTLLSTGSPLHPSQFEWVYRAIKEDLLLSSMSGGTDLIGCFVGGSPLHSVRAGEISCKALGMKVESLDDAGLPVLGEKGELACATPFPSMPIGFWNDPDGSKYRRAYFERFPGKWHHGDFIEIFEDGASIIHGRSDATLNPGGVRIGTAEIYKSIQGIPGIVDAIAVGRQAGNDEQIALFVVLASSATLTEDLRDRIRKRIRAELSPLHVPAEIHAITEVPRTVSGKAVELAVASLLRGEEVSNREALANPSALDQFKAFAR